MSDFGITITIAIKNIIPLGRLYQVRASQRLAEKYLNPNLNTKNPSFRPLERIDVSSKNLESKKVPLLKNDSGTVPVGNDSVVAYKTEFFLYYT